MSSALNVTLIGVLFLLSAAPTTLASQAAPKSIEIFTVTDRPVASDPAVDVTTYHLDALDQLEARLSQGLPGDPAQAKSIALQRINALEAELQDDVERAVEGLSRARAYGLRSLPAIVFDEGQSVIYGVQDLGRALALYRERKGS